MAKDPALLFYTSDFLTKTMFMTDEQVGRYIRLLCIQHQLGRIHLNYMKQVCNGVDEMVFSMFKIDKNGCYYNFQLEIEINRRKKYCESRRNNRMQSKIQPVKPITYDKHMETATVTEANVLDSLNLSIPDKCTECGSLCDSTGDCLNTECDKSLPF